MNSGPRELEPIERPTFLAHALTLSALHGTARPWPDGGYPLPDEAPQGKPTLLTSVVQDGIESHHFKAKQDGDPAELANEVVAALDDDSWERLVALHDQLARQRALGVVDDLLAELRERDVPEEPLRGLASRLCETGWQRDAVKLGIALLGTVADERDRELLLLLGSLEEFTLFAVVALRNSQSDRHRAVRELAQRVGGWGRIHAVERLRGCTDPEIKAWLLRDGFRNGVMNEYLAHVAATTGDLYGALLEPDVDDALLDGAGDILAALAMGGPAEDIRQYPDALPALHRYLDLISDAAPTLDRLSNLLTLGRLLSKPYDGLDWSDDERAVVAERFKALLARPIWAHVTRDHLASPVGTYGFSRALSCARRLGLPIHDVAAEHLETHPFDAYVWQTLLDEATQEGIGELTELAERLLPLGELSTGPADDLGLGGGYEADMALQVVLQRLQQVPGVGTGLIRAGLANRTVQSRRAALKVLSAWPPAAVLPEVVEWVRQAEQAEPDPKLKGELAETLAGWQPSAASA